MSATMTVTPFDGKLVTIDSPLSYDEFTSRLDAETNKKEAAGTLIPFMASPSSKEAIIEKITELTGDNRNFLFFLQLNHTWIRRFDPNAPRASVYMIGNPLIAQTMMKHDLRAGYHVPPRVMVSEKPDGTGTSIAYHLPSSVIVITENPDLRAAAEDLDSKLQQLLIKVASSN